MPHFTAKPVPAGPSFDFIDRVLVEASYTAKAITRFAPQPTETELLDYTIDLSVAAAEHVDGGNVEAFMAANAYGTLLDEETKIGLEVSLGGNTDTALLAWIDTADVIEAFLRIGSPDELVAWFVERANNAVASAHKALLATT